jgi:hypothetical protein
VDKAIAWYLVELERRLIDQQMPEERRKEILIEVEEHLSELREELLQPRVAIRCEDLVDRFGEPADIARSFSERRSPEYNWRLTALIVGAMCFFSSVPFVGMVMHSHGYDVPFNVAIPVAALPLLLALIKARRIAFIPLAAGTAASVVLLSTLLAATTFDLGEPDGMSILLKHELPKVRAENNERVAQLQRLLTEVTSGEAAFATKDAQSLAKMRGPDGAYRALMGLSYGSTYSKPYLSYSHMQSLDEAASSWRPAVARMARRSISHEISRARETLANLEKPGHPFLVQLNAYAASVRVPAVILFLGAFTLNVLVWLCFAIADAARNGWRRRRRTA